MTIIIKNAKIENLQQIQELNSQLCKKEHEEYDYLINLNWSFGEEATKYFTNRINSGCVLVAIYNNKIVGYLCGELTKAETYRNLPLTAELENTFILEEFRSKGIGTKLYLEFTKWCRSKGVGKIRVEADTHNILGIKFYKRNGFKEYSLVLEANL